jgi:uncharacterized membrane protein YtjA (UPF0391 family)
VYGPSILKSLKGASSYGAREFEGAHHSISNKGGFMLQWALAFFVIALIAAVFGFLGIATAAVGVAKILFFVFLILFVVSLVGGLLRRA